MNLEILIFFKNNFQNFTLVKDDIVEIQTLEGEIFDKKIDLVLKDKQGKIVSLFFTSDLDYSTFSFENLKQFECKTYNFWCFLTFKSGLNFFLLNPIINDPYFNQERFVDFILNYLYPDNIN